MSVKSRLGEKGFTLIELVVGISIAAFVVGAASMTTITMMRLTPRNNDWAVALHQVQNAGYWISRDVQMAQGDITINAWPSSTFLTMTLPEWDGDLDEVVTKMLTYEFEDMPGGLKRLMRNNQTDAEETMIAGNISNAAADFTVASGMLTFTIEATAGDIEVSRDYEAMQRVPPAPEEPEP
jgi:prepilin-type N-terminal cleavage/methylation domain-containing protein